MAKSRRDHRPRIRFFGGKWHRSKKSRLFSGPVMLNPRRRRHSRKRRSFMFRHNPMVSVRYPRSHRRHYRHNPFNLRGVGASMKRIVSRPWLTKIGTIGGGIAAGMAGKSLVVSLMPRIGLGQFTQYSGAGNIILGSIIAGMMRKPMLKEIGVTMAAVGLYDLIASSVPMLRLPVLPSIDVMSMVPGMAPSAVSASYPVPTLPVSPVARLSSSYGQAQRAGYAGSYLAPDMHTEGFRGDDNPYSDIF